VRTLGKPRRLLATQGYSKVREKRKRKENRQEAGRVTPRRLLTATCTVLFI
jgi:hypothetical protein